MPIRYGLLKGKPVQGTRTDKKKKPHYDLRVLVGGGENSQTWQVPVNVRSDDGSEVRFYQDVDLGQNGDARLKNLWAQKTSVLTDLDYGFTDSLPIGIALDYAREGYFERGDSTHLPANGDGNDDDVQDYVDAIVQLAISREWTVYVFGEAFPSLDNPTGVHDIHMNQGNPPDHLPDHSGDNGVFQDGGLFFHTGNRWLGLFFFFESQSWQTDATTGFPS